MDDALRVRDFWFGTRPLSAQSLSERMKIWFPDEEPTPMRARNDAVIAARFTELVERAATGSLASWADSPRRRLSLIILLDQFPRNIFRGLSRAFAYDDQALELALSGMQLAADGALSVAERMFFYMPLQHAEILDVQDESVAAFRRLLAEAPEELRGTFENTLQHAEAHRTVIRRFGRFPRRNVALARPDTPEEKLYRESLAAASSLTPLQ